MNGERITIDGQEYDIISKADAVLCNYAGGIDGMAMQEVLTVRDADGDLVDVSRYYDIADGQEQDDELIYTADNVLDVCWR